MSCKLLREVSSQWASPVHAARCRLPAAELVPPAAPRAPASHTLRRPTAPLVRARPGRHGDAHGVGKLVAEHGLQLDGDEDLGAAHGSPSGEGRTSTPRLFLISLITVTTQRLRITLKPRRNLGQDGPRTHVPCDPDAIKHVRKIAASTGLSQRQIVTTILTKTDLPTFVELWNDEPLESPTDIYRELGDGMTVKTATVGAPRRSRLTLTPTKTTGDTDAAAGGERVP